LDLFTFNIEKNIKKNAPLADRLRPEKIEDFIGQEHIIGENKLLYRLIKADKITSIILYGPPGTGKTTLAKIISETTNLNFEKINAVTSGVKDIREIIEKAKEVLGMYNKRTILFIDEIHRFNKSQQDALLPYVENGTLILIGATTENPYFEVNKALISRSTIFKLNPLGEEEIIKLIIRAINDNEKGLGMFNLRINKDTIKYLANRSNGDGRTALNTLELAVTTTKINEDGYINITTDVINDCIQRRNIRYEKNGDEHFDTISAFIKSMRGSDPDATLHYLAKMIYSGEDPKYIGRRIIICASEDVGNADPNALTVAMNAFKAVEIIGMPEGRIPLAQAAIYIACAPKSNSCYNGINKALEDIEKNIIEEVPIHIKDRSYEGSKKLGNGNDYKYPHDYEGNYVNQQYLPNNLKDVKYYYPTDNGWEKEIKERIENIKNKNKNGS